MRKICSICGEERLMIDDVTWELVEVIGNIYENPELLEGS